MDNTNNISKLPENLLEKVRKTVLVTNMSLAAALEQPFLATYDCDHGIIMMGLKTNNTAIVVATSFDSNTVIKCDFIIADGNIAEKRSVFKCDNKSDADDVWEIITDRLDDWSHGRIPDVDIE